MSTSCSSAPTRRSPTATTCLPSSTSLAKQRGTQDLFGEHNPIRDLPNWLTPTRPGTCLPFFQRIDAGTRPPRPRLHRPVAGHPLPGRPLPGPVGGGPQEVRPAPDARLRRGVHPRPHARPGHRGVRPGEARLREPARSRRAAPPRRRFRMIDPACGSGHFLLGSFARLLDRWRRKEPGSDVAVLVQRALDGVHGVDAQPLRDGHRPVPPAAGGPEGVRSRRGWSTPRSSPPPGLRRLAAARQHGGDPGIMGWAPTDHVYQPEDAKHWTRLLRPGSYHAVVANPPYITPKDRIRHTDPILKAMVRSHRTDPSVPRGPHHGETRWQTT